MAHSEPQDLQNVGDAWRVTMAAGGFAIALMEDERVQGLFETFRTGRAMAATKLEALASQASGADVAEDWIDDFVQRAFADVQRGENEFTERFVRDSLRLERWQQWLCPALYSGFQAWSDFEHGDTRRKQFAIHVPMRADAPQGRRPRNDGSDIIRAARWFYRAEVKQPPDSINAIGKEYADTANRDNDCRSVVQNAIAQVRALLDLVDIPAGHSLIVRATAENS